ncbi:MAG: methionyl-tRNA formyltransferase [Betaproteobacteria bacterium]|nr:MAG: methionyl-tRNA formyltransferase [Betaproteobacteria bacterium]
MRIVFAGTPAFAACALQALLDAGHEATLVLAQPEKPAGRGLKALPGAVRTLAEQRGIPLFQPPSLKAPDALSRIAAAHPEVLVVAAYGQIFPQAVLDLAPHGAVNIHASLLPRWRGAAPVQRALLAGDLETGITIMRMDAGLDTGPIILQRELKIAPDDDAQTLGDRLAALGSTSIVAALAALAAGRAQPTPQPAVGAIYAPKITKLETVLDWSRAALVLERTVRAFRPAPGARTLMRDQPIKIWSARLAVGEAEPGTVLQAGPAGLRVACGEGALDLLEVQRAGGRRQTAGEFLRGFAVHPGERLGAAR